MSTRLETVGFEQLANVNGGIQWGQTAKAALKTGAGGAGGGAIGGATVGGIAFGPPGALGGGIVGGAAGFIGGSVAGAAADLGRQTGRW